MGFSDLLTSSRGPGVIGTLMALLVLVGFSTLYIFVFDEGLQGGQKTISAVIRDQGYDIDNLKIQIKNAEKRLEDAAESKRVGREADEQKAKSDRFSAQIAELTDAKASAEQAIQASQDTWETYKDEYRSGVWAAAVGEKLEDIKTVDGEVFTNVTVSGVDHKGVRITHSGGSRTISPEDLPADLFDHYQFDLEKKKAIETEAGEVMQEHVTNVEIATLAKEGNDKLSKAQRLKSEISDLNTKIQNAKLSVPRFQAAIDRKRIDLANERGKRGGISRAPQMGEELKIMERTARENRDSISANERRVRTANGEIDSLQRDVARIKSKIAEIKAAEAAKSQPAAP